MKDIQHVLGISGGKDSAALALYLREKYPSFNFIYYCSDTGKELDETYQLIENLEETLGIKIKRLESKESEDAGKNPFDYFHGIYRGYLPASNARWCTKKMKLDPFEKWIGDKPSVSYVGIRGDENREGYISKKPNIQSIFPFRKNIWSEDVMRKLIANASREKVLDLYSNWFSGAKLDEASKIILQPLELLKDDKLGNAMRLRLKIDKMLDLGVSPFNKVVFDFLKGSAYPLAFENDYPLLENEDIIIRDDVFRILRESGVGVPAYYEKVEYDLDGEKGHYARSRSGCFFCFFQQKIEWVWLLETHPELYEAAKVYENEDEGFLWNEGESLTDLANPRRVEHIKRDQINLLKKQEANKKTDSPYLLDILDGDEGIGCEACFI